jgi:diguanylate cyclase (GGDEF)-like protein/PAS domain S-box-containing protein
MSAPKQPRSCDPDEEIPGLIEALHKTESRLEELTAGEVDSVTSRDGRVLLLRRSQDRLRRSEASRQSAILDALPVNVALLDGQGRIVSVNEAWRRYARENGLQTPDAGVGASYLEICDRARGSDVSEARAVARGIRSVLSGEAQHFNLEYPCHTSARKSWWRLMVAPLMGDRPNGVVIIHLDVSVECQIALDLRASELRFRQMAESIRDVFFLYDASTGRNLYISPAYEEIWGRPCADLRTNPEAWLESIHPEDRATIRAQYLLGKSTNKFAYEFRIVRPDGAIRWIKARGFPVCDEAGVTVRLAGIAQDVTEREHAEQEVRELDRRMSDMLGKMQLLSVMLDDQARITYCNDYFLALTDWRRDEVIGRDWFELFQPVQMGELRPVFMGFLANPPESWHRENSIVTRSGESRTIRWNISVLRSGAEAVIGTASIGEDITERQKAESRVAYLSRVRDMLSSINTLIVRVRDRDELLRGACRVAVDKGGLLMSLVGALDGRDKKLVPVGMAGKDAKLLSTVEGIIAAGQGVATAMVTQAIRQKKAIVANDSQHDPTVAFRDHHSSFKVRSMAVLPLVVAEEVVAVLALYSGEADFFLADEMNLLSELTDNIALAIEHIQQRERLSYLAYYDSLTGLMNRSRLHELLERGNSAGNDVAQMSALALLDIERFKAINDGFGRNAGDALLKELAARLTAYAADVDRVARIDADHFAVVISSARTEEEVAVRMLQLLAAAFGRPFQVGAAELRLSAKCGIAMFVGDGKDGDVPIREAEAALKNAKSSGERWAFYTETMNERAAERVSFESELRRAVDHGEFELHYQPKVSMTSGAVTGVEALIRWNRPRIGLVSPGKFIPILEAIGLIHEVGRWALGQAIEDHRRWRTMGMAAPRIAVNVSPLQLRSQTFTQEVATAIGTDPDAAGGLELEITESLLMENVKHSVASLLVLRAMGLSIAIDDFGTGYSSLSYLSRLPLDTLKIDRSFVADMTVTETGHALVSTIINLGRSLKLKIVAEGVETDGQAQMLRLLGCDEMQGFLISKPLTRESFESTFLLPAQISQASMNPRRS